MKHAVLTLLFAAICGTVFSQYDYCASIQKGNEAAGSNFSSYQNLAYNPLPYLKAYYADFSFSPEKDGYVYRNITKNEVYYKQTLSNTVAKFEDIVKAYEKCLLADKNKWIRTDSKDKTAVGYDCYKTGISHYLISGNDLGVVVTIQIKKEKTIPVFAVSFNKDLQAIIKDLDDGFRVFTGAVKRESRYSITYKTKINLNQRNSSAYIEKTFYDIDTTKAAYFFSEMISEDDIAFDDISSRFESFLSSKAGWKKGKPRYGEGVSFEKGNTIVELTYSKSVLKDRSANTFIKIKKADKAG